jgi:hypothetical protein
MNAAPTDAGHKPALDAGNSGHADSGTDAGSAGDGGACMPTPPPIDPADLTACGDNCGAAHCVPTTLLTPEQGAMLADCDTATKCVPDMYIETNGMFLLKTCKSLKGAEGRCVSSCVPKVASQIDSLPQDVCQKDERCAPCYDPITGEDSGACTLGCDTGPTKPPVKFAECCDGHALCVPKTSVPEDQRSMLPTEGCKDSTDLCVPKAMASGYDPKTCMSWGGAEGRCLSDCLPSVQQKKDKLGKDVCSSGELCVPCFDPISGDSTGACAIDGDAPTHDAYKFATCCSDGASGTLGTCVPDALVSEDQRSMLGADTCSEQKFLCAPADVAAGTYAPDTCTSWRSAEGRCLPACLPAVAKKADKLSAADCGQGKLCVPCFDPVTGESTNGCTMEGDKPANTTPVLFPTCCVTNGVARGTCVPKAAAGAQGASLPVLDCETKTNDADAYVCAPNEKLSDPPSAFPSCTTACPKAPESTTNAWICSIGALAGKAGACVPACILSEKDAALGAKADTVFGRSTCAEGEKCAPCNDPQSGDATGLCE